MMSQTLSMYSTYKDSGVKWLGKVPKHWSIERLKSAVTNVIEQTAIRRNGDLYVALEHVESWTGRLRIADSDAVFDSQVKRFRLGDVLFGKLRPYLAKVTLASSDGVCVGEFLVLRPRTSNVGAPYLEQLLRSKLFIDVVSSSTFGAKMPRADWQFIGGMPIMIPSPDEQAAIVKYLDFVGRWMQRCIRAKQKLIKLLEEQKQAIIHRAVTRGLDPTVPLKPSGISWLGDIPQHWEVRKLRTVSDLIVSNVDKHSKVNEISVRLCNYVDVYKNDSINERIAFMRATATSDEITRFRIRKGDVIITKDSEEWDDIGVPSLVTYEAEDLLCGYHLAILRPRLKRCVGPFLHRVLEDRFVATQMYTRANGVTRYGLSHSLIKDVLIPLPPILEQGPICSQLNANLKAIVAATTRLEREIELLREYRTRLVADVVTGKLDVREAATRLPDEEKDIEATDDLEVFEGEE